MTQHQKSNDSGFEYPWGDMEEVMFDARRLQAQEIDRLVKKAAGAISTMFKNINEAFDNARTFQEMMDMSDAQLADIGISRDDIPELIRSTIAKHNAQQVSDVAVASVKASAQKLPANDAGQSLAA